jgi:redox-sensitive bicupin YhaK (pirin superfamily)
VIRVRRSNERGGTALDWLNSRHTFSFGEYHDPRQMGVGPLRVINEDRVRPGAGFATHGHRDMEIVSYVLDGALAHRDSLGTGSVIRPGDVQRMSAGTGILHSEYNASPDEPVHFLQIWIVPREKGLEPGYEQKSFSEAEKRGRLRLVGSPDGRDGSLTIHQDVDLYAGLLGAGASAALNLRPGRRAWVQVVRGEIDVNGHGLAAGDGAEIIDVDTLRVRGLGEAEALVFDVPA